MGNISNWSKPENQSKNATLNTHNIHVGNFLNLDTWTLAHLSGEEAIPGNHKTLTLTETD